MVDLSSIYNLYQKVFRGPRDRKSLYSSDLAIRYDQQHKPLFRRGWRGDPISTAIHVSNQITLCTFVCESTRLLV